jgi:hypothetical protein
MLVLIPPAMLLPPAALARFVQFAALVVGLAAVAPVAFDGFVQLVLGMSDATLAAVDVFGVRSRHCAKQQNGAQDRSCQHRYGWNRQLVRLNHRQKASVVVMWKQIVERFTPGQPFRLSREGEALRLGPDARDAWLGRTAANGFSPVSPGPKTRMGPQQL